jgi:hypothetical protein
MFVPCVTVMPLRTGTAAVTAAETMNTADHNFEKLRGPVIDMLLSDFFCGTVET